MDRDPEDRLTPSRETGLAEGDIVEKTVKSCRSAGIPQIEIDWKDQIRPALEKTFDSDREYVFHPRRIRYETGLSVENVEEGFRYYRDEMEPEGFKLEYEANGFWKLQRLTV